MAVLCRIIVGKAFLNVCRLSSNCLVYLAGIGFMVAKNVSLQNQAYIL